MQLQLDIDIYTWKKLEHRAAEDGRAVEEYAAEVLEKEAEMEHEKVFAKKVEATQFSAPRRSPSLRARRVASTRREA